MNLTAEQLQIASMIDSKVQALAGAGCDDAAILGEMLDYMPGFKRLMDTSHGGEMDELCRRFPWFYRYAKILGSVAAGILEPVAVRRRYLRSVIASARWRGAGVRSWRGAWA